MSIIEGSFQQKILEITKKEVIDQFIEETKNKRLEFLSRKSQISESDVRCETCKRNKERGQLSESLEVKLNESRTKDITEIFELID